MDIFTGYAISFETVKSSKTEFLTHPQNKNVSTNKPKMYKATQSLNERATVRSSFFFLFAPGVYFFQCSLDDDYRLWHNISILVVCLRKVQSSSKEEEHRRRCGGWWEAEEEEVQPAMVSAAAATAAASGSGNGNSLGSRAGPPCSAGTATT